MIETQDDGIISLRDLQLIGIAGHAGVGKDTVAQYLHNKYQNTYVEHFADPLKRACAAAFGVPLEDFSNPHTKNEETFWGVSPRQIAQFVGTEMFRNGPAMLYPDRGPTHWVNLLEARLTGISALPPDEGLYTAGDTVIIADVRFQDEYDWIQNNGGVIIHIKRPGFNGAVGIPGHASENGIHRMHGQVFSFINDGTPEELCAAVERALINHTPFTFTPESF